jgi:hypothetical protein
MMQYILLVLGLVFVFSYAGYDTNGDGLADWDQSILKDENNDGSFDRHNINYSKKNLSDSLQFFKVWDSGSYLNNQWGADCGYFDDDSLLDLLGTHYAPNQLHVFESDEQGGYNHLWVQTESMPPGSYGAVTHGDPDDDGQIEILGGDVSTLGKVVLFENIGNDTWAEPHVLFRTNLRLRAIRIADTNGNDTNEIIVFCGNTDGGKVQIYEHTGAAGVHSYTLRYEYTTVSYLFNGEVGDADNDGYPEMLLGFGGWHGYPMYMRRIVYDPITRTYSHHMYESTVIGLHMTPEIADLDNSGDNELIVGSSGSPFGQFHIFKHIAGDTFQPLWSSNMTIDGNIISLHAAQFQDYDYPVIFAAPFSGAILGFTKDDTAWHGISYFATSGPVRSVGSALNRVPGEALTDQLVLSENGVEQITVWRPQNVQSIRENKLFEHKKISIYPNPAQNFIRINNNEKCVLWNISGQKVSELYPGLNDLRHLAQGVYLVGIEKSRILTKIVINR